MKVQEHLYDHQIPSPAGNSNEMTKCWAQVDSRFGEELDPFLVVRQENTFSIVRLSL
jgi:hypothetical protein